MRRLSLVFVVAGAVWMAGTAVIAQGGRGAQAPMNLEVLPDTWSRQQVGALMQTFTKSLGVQCAHCHTEDPDAPPPQPGQNPRLDYALKTKPERDVALNMIRMVMNLNEGARQPTDDASVEKISCFTCHRGETTPDKEPEDGWGRGSFALTEAGPVLPARGGGPRGGGPATPPSN